MQFGTRAKSALALAMAVAGATAAHAAPLDTLSLTGGSSIAWTTNASNQLVNSGPATDAQLAALLNGDAASPGSNVELSKFGGPVTTLTGYAGGHKFELSSLNSDDWTANGNALARAYITGAADSVGLDAALTPAALSAAITTFTAQTAGIDPWERVSDPNISYADLADGVLAIGLAGYLDARAVLVGLFGAPLVSTIPAGVSVQVSEVVKLSVDDGPAQYLFGFDATPSNLVSADPTRSFTGNYQVTAEVPEPSSFALLGLGLAGVAVARRRKADKR